VKSLVLVFGKCCAKLSRVFFFFFLFSNSIRNFFFVSLFLLRLSAFPRRAMSAADLALIALEEVSLEGRAGRGEKKASEGSPPPIKTAARSERERESDALSLDASFVEKASECIRRFQTLAVLL